MDKINEKVIMISGGSRGLGQAFVDHFIKQNYRVATFSRSKSAFIEAMETEHAANFYWKQMDIRNQDELKQYVLDVQKRFGRIDGLINNAGATLDRLLPITSEQEIQDTLFLNLQSAITLSRHVCRAMLCQKNGYIINISSVLGKRGFKGVSVYSASKSALDGFSRSLARELGSKGIRVNSIAPGFLATDMTHGMAEARKNQIIRRTPLGRLGKVEDVVGLIRFLTSPEASFITGQTFVVDGGLTC